MLLELLKQRRVALGVLGVLALAGVLQFTNTNPAVSQTLYLTAYESESDPGLDPSSGAWKDALPVNIALTAQAGSYAAGGGTVTTIGAKALHHNDTLYIRVEWDDASKNDSAIRAEDFADGVAIEFPSKTATTVPSICMGQADSGVNIWHWRADSDAGLRDPADVYTTSSVDMYPYKDNLFYTAREAGNPYANPELGAVQTLVSRAFGELTTSSIQDTTGHGSWVDGKWAVVFARPYSSQGLEHADFAAGTSTDMAFAVWDGENDERNGMKSTSQFITLAVSGAPLPGEDGMDLNALAIGGILLVLFTALGIGLGIYGYREGRS